MISYLAKTAEPFTTIPVEWTTLLRKLALEQQGKRIPSITLISLALKRAEQLEDYTSMFYILPDNYLWNVPIPIKDYLSHAFASLKYSTHYGRMGTLHLSW